MSQTIKSTLEKSKPSEYHNLEDFQIIYGRYETQFGECLVALKDDRVCYNSFIDRTYTELTELSRMFPKATLIRNDALIARTVKKYFDGEETPQLLLFGTDFENKIWEHLINVVIKGKTTTCDKVAKSINKPNAVYQVKKAINNNKIAYFVPCHRVISKNGAQYKWGIQRKSTMLRAEKELAKRKLIEQLQRSTNLSITNNM